MQRYRGMVEHATHITQLLLVLLKCYQMRQLQDIEKRIVKLEIQMKKDLDRKGYSVRIKERWTEFSNGRTRKNGRC